MKKSKSLQALLRRERARGRAEAVTIIAGICPEDGIDGLIGCSPNGESGDYSSYWDVDALRKLLCADTEACDVIDRLQGAHEFTSYLKHDLAKACEALELVQTDASRFNCVVEDMLSDLARRYSNDVSDDLEDVLLALDAAVAVKSQRTPPNFYPTPANLQYWRAISE